MNIDEMQAGRDLDILVSLKVFSSLDDMKRTPGFVVPAYSTDIAAAFLVSQKIAEKIFIDDILDLNCEKGINSLTLAQVGTKDWCAAFMSDCDLPEDWIEDANSLPFANNASTPALAICRAALKVVMSTELANG